MREDTLAVQLQKRMDLQEYSLIRIVVTQTRWHHMQALNQLPLREQDIIVFCGTELVLDSVKDFAFVHTINMLDLFKNQRGENWFWGEMIHTTAAGNRAVADFLYTNYLKPEIEEKRKLRTNHYVFKGEIADEESRTSIHQYVLQLPVKKGRNGAVVMNCNPFTRGHQYLIEQAAKEVDFLYVFVVQEDKSFFKFEDRLQLVKEGIAYLSNVVVVPSGEFILSYQTFPSYFKKEEQKDVKIDASCDIELFARYIAPELNISCRFAGEEPMDFVTRQYNEQMADILPEFDIEFREIPRLCTGTDEISASKVRALLQEENWKELVQLVPETTWRYLKQQFGQNRE